MLERRLKKRPRTTGAVTRRGTTWKCNILLGRWRRYRQWDGVSHLVERLGNELSFHEILFQVSIPPERENKRTTRRSLIAPVSFQAP